MTARIDLKCKNYIASNGGMSSLKWCFLRMITNQMGEFEVSIGGGLRSINNSGTKAQRSSWNYSKY